MEVDGSGDDDEDDDGYVEDGFVVDDDDDENLDDSSSSENDSGYGSTNRRRLMPKTTMIVNQVQTFMIQYRNKEDFIQEHDTSSIGICLFTTSAARVKLYQAMKKIVETEGLQNVFVVKFTFDFRLHFAIHGHGFVDLRL